MSTLIDCLLVSAFSIRNKNYLCRKLGLYDYPEIQRGLGKQIFGLPASAVKRFEEERGLE